MCEMFLNCLDRSKTWPFWLPIHWKELTKWRVMNSARPILCDGRELPIQCLQKQMCGAYWRLYKWCRSKRSRVTATSCCNNVSVAFVKFYIEMNTERVDDDNKTLFYDPIWICPTCGAGLILKYSDLSDRELIRGDRTHVLCRNHNSTST